MYFQPIMEVFKTNLTNYVSQIIKRNIFRSSVTKCYDGEQGKTTATILNNEADLGLMVDGYSEVGFRLNNNVTVLGPILLFPRSVLSWAVDGVEDISEDSLSLLTVIEPKIDVVVIGVGDKMNHLPYSKKILQIMRKHKLSIEILPTAQACPTFNFLNSEGRFVVGAMIPPKNINVTDDELLRTKLRYQSLYEIND